MLRELSIIWQGGLSELPIKALADNIKHISQLWGRGGPKMELITPEDGQMGEELNLRVSRRVGLATPDEAGGVGTHTMHNSRTLFFES